MPNQSQVKRHLKQPDDLDRPVWRYMGLARLLWRLFKRQLWMTRPDVLSDRDKFEGIAPPTVSHALMTSDRVLCENSAEVLQPALDARVTPGRVLGRHAYHECRDVRLGARATGRRVFEPSYFLATSSDTTEGWCRVSRCRRCPRGSAGRGPCLSRLSGAAGRR
jgi:hypothetical protein